MTARTFSLAIGIAFLVAGVLGFVPGALHPPHPGVPDLRVDSWYGYLLNLFPVNILHNIVHLAVGVIGIMSSSRERGAIDFARGLAVFYGVLTVMGLIPGLNT